MTLTCIVVDDSFVQKLSIKKLVEHNSNLLLTGDYNNVMDAKKHLRNEKIDLIFLDIEMPVLSGFDLLDSLEDLPQIIFVTGKIEYAFKAFNYDATDYLQKPVSAEKFNRAVSRAIEVKKLRDQKSNAFNNDFIFIKANSKNIKLFLNEIKYLEAMGDYVKVVSDFNSYMVLSTMKHFEKNLPVNFMRVHKSFIVNMTRVEGFDHKNILLGDVSIPISRNKKQDIESSIVSNSQ
ncbi:MAG: DNA-binding response regulator [Flavobacteriales bacterium CG_4_9_14_3_um_filter_40_17]|nr:MAG: DNA-binding response regulator [Flavobacteriales bacterium CG_4_9_14_3_um_filter_40_17]